jgi:hypothetical protein
MTSLYGEWMDVKPEGFAVDKRFPDIIYVREDVRFDLHAQTLSWVHEGAKHHAKLLPTRTYVRPSGYKVQMVKPPGGRAWRLVGTVAEGTLCHKPCTVSGGGKSEISKPIGDAIIQGPVFVADFHQDFDRVVEELVFVVKRFYRPEWGENWLDHFGVDIINGVPAHELKCANRKLIRTICA